MEGEKQKAICCDSSEDPVFGYNCDIYVCDQCNENSGSFTDFDHCTNVTEQPAKIVFTDLNRFQAEEIEVFEIIG
jgi:hypothetical protein